MTSKSTPAKLLCGISGLVLMASVYAASVGPAVAKEDNEFPIAQVGPEVNPDLPNIVVLDTGGTITSGAETRISYLNYGGQGPANGLRTILEDMYPELETVANLSVVDLAGNDYSISSSGSVTMEKLYVISRTIDQYLADPEVDGVVLIAGTNVLEEDAYFFDLTVRSPKPVVLTGSMHQYGTFTFDGYTNVFSSIRLAASARTTCFGTVVLLNDQIFGAREVTKTDGYRMDTFEGGNYGALGVVNQDNIRLLRATSRVLDCGTDDWASPFDLSTITPQDFPIVDIISGHVESSPGPMTGAVDNGAAGLVVSGHGPGGLSALQANARQAALDAGVVIVSASRTGGEGTYDNGGMTIGAGDLLPQKARMLLQISLAFTEDIEQVRDWFNTIGAAQIDMSSIHY